MSTHTHTRSHKGERHAVEGEVYPIPERVRKSNDMHKQAKFDSTDSHRFLFALDGAGL